MTFSRAQSVVMTTTRLCSSYAMDAILRLILIALAWIPSLLENGFASNVSPGASARLPSSPNPGAVDAPGQINVGLGITTRCMPLTGPECGNPSGTSSTSTLIFHLMTRMRQSVFYSNRDTMLRIRESLELGNRDLELLNGKVDRIDSGKPSLLYSRCEEAGHRARGLEFKPLSRNLWMKSEHGTLLSEPMLFKKGQLSTDERENPQLRLQLSRSQLSRKES